MSFLTLSKSAHRGDILGISTLEKGLAGAHNRYSYSGSSCLVFITSVPPTSFSSQLEANYSVGGCEGGE